jgi:hypothetical protein
MDSWNAHKLGAGACFGLCADLGAPCPLAQKKEGEPAVISIDCGRELRSGEHD